MHCIETIKKMNKDAEKREIAKMADVARRFNMVHAEYVVGLRAFENARRKTVVTVK